MDQSMVASGRSSLTREASSHGSHDDDDVIRVEGLTKVYVSGEVETQVLRSVDLTIRRGEMVAIIGTSGSGKSTLLHILGCLDRPTSGSYHLLGHDVSGLDAVERARVRGLVLGFVFQGFHLLPGTTALENVELPLVYRGASSVEREAQALAALTRVGLGDRAHHTPAQLSGGQQQRVAIARALVTRPEVLFADELTGNLDSATTHDVLGLLQQLHEEEGLTVVMVTHDPEVARAATRIITVKDGRIVADTPVTDRRQVHVSAGAAGADVVAARAAASARKATVISPLGLVSMGLRLALQSLRRSVLRTALTTLGILIGVAAVVTTSGIGAGAKERMEKEMTALGANVLMVNQNWNRSNGGARGAPGSGGGLTRADADAIRRELPAVAASAPVQAASTQIVVGAKNVPTRVTGTTPSFLTIRAWQIESGRAFDDADVTSAAAVCLIGKTVEKTLFPGGENPLGTTVRVDRMPCTIEGVLKGKGQSGGGQDQDDLILMPITTYRAHINRKAGDDVDSIVVSARDAGAVLRAQSQITALLKQRHDIGDDEEDDFMVRNLTEMLNALDSQRAAITMLLLVMASVSLIVGGIGVMNIMLVSVTERTREIGVRLAIGARPVDILTQFLLEAIVLAVMGGLAGLALGAAAGQLVGSLTDYNVSLQPESALLAIVISCGIGVVFGFFPARSAAALDPIQALRHE
ncbi:MAG: ABC transporter permease [Deltaproteobacteria bacterium]|nr:ABC transporter permease [Deltaproteobacteria bacterium]